MDELERFRREKDGLFRTAPQSPLSPEQRQAFTGLHYFPPKADLDLVVEVERLPERQSVEIQTSTGDVRSYERFGRFRFSVEGQEVTLTVYRNEDGYFLPFADSLAGKETYGAGRYLEPEELPDGRFAVNFNLAYNPYCAYNAKWSCPITPAENRIKVPIRAGEKVFEAQA
jgi:uncharacterized protein (DUF1684 family)